MHMPIGCFLIFLVFMQIVNSSELKFSHPRTVVVQWI